MFVLMMATFGSHPIPSVIFKQLQEITNLHRLKIMAPFEWGQDSNGLEFI